MSTPTKTYRLYCYDSASQILTGDWIEAANDEDAVAKAKARGFATKSEVWESTRLVATFEQQPGIPAAGDLSDQACARSA